jgi:hypothetical protein
MNGRVYDPILGRFIQPDNYIQEPDNLQNFNRYAYCYNNPLSYTDPSGNFIGMALFLGETAFLGTTYLFEGGHSNPYNDAFVETSYMFDEVKNMLSFTSSYGNGSYTAGIDPFAVGVYIGFQGRKGDLDYGVTMGLGLSGPYAFGRLGYSVDDWRFGIGGGVFSNGYSYGGEVSYQGYGVEYYETVYGKSSNNPTSNPNPQSVGGVKIFGPNWSFKMENDFAANFFKGSGDKWRTGGFELSVNKFSVGFSIYTNQQINGIDEVDEKGISSIWGENRPDKDGNKGSWKNGIVYDSPIWIGYNYGYGISRIGFSNKYVQDATQNGIHKWIPFGRQNYYNNYSTGINHFYGYSSYYNPYSLYGK